MRALLMLVVIVSSFINTALTISYRESKGFGDSRDFSTDDNEEAGVADVPARPNELNSKSNGGWSIFNHLAEMKNKFLSENVRASVHPFTQRAINAFGAMYKLGTSARNAMKRTRSRVSQGTVTAAEIWRKIDMKGKDPEEKIKMLIDVLSEEMINHVPEYTKIAPKEEKSKSKYACGAKGLMRDLRTMKKVNDTVQNVNRDRYKIEINYTFTNLHFVYKIFYINVVNLFTYKGELDLKFNQNNNVKVTMQLSKFSEIPTKLLSKQCIVRVVNFEVTQLKLNDTTFTDGSNGLSNKFANYRISANLNKNQEDLRRTFEVRTLEEIHRQLVTQDHWICKDKGFGDLVKAKGGNLEDFVITPQFKQGCGTDLYVEPYKKPVLEEIPLS